LFEVQRGLIAESAVQADPVIKGVDVSEDSEAGLGAGGKRARGQALTFESGPEAFDVGIIVTVGLATHTLE
jgi:hypothetical protein